MATVIPLGAPQGMPPAAPAAPATSPAQSAAQQQPAAPPVHPDLQRPPSAVNTQAVAVDELQALRTAQQELAAIRAAQQVTAEQEAQRHFQSKAKEDPLSALDLQRAHFEKLLGEERQVKERLEAERLNERRDLVLNATLAGVTFAGDTPEEKATTAAYLRRIIQDDFEAIRNASGQIEVREKVSGRPAADVLRERLSSKQLALFLAPATRGGSGTDGSRVPGNPQAPEQLNDIQRQQLAFMQSRQQYPAFGLVPGSLPRGGPAQ